MDPVTANSGTGANFNRYWYAGNNPYKFTDPDGRCFWDGCVVEAMAAGAIIGGVANASVQMYRAEGSLSDKFGAVNWKQVGVAAAAGALGGGAGTVASTAVTTAGTIGANTIAGAAIGAGAVHASAAVEGKTASTGDVIKGAAIGGVLSGAASGIASVPGAPGRAASASMSQTERVAMGNFVQGVANTTRNAGGTPNFAPAGQGAANGAAAVISNSGNLEAQPRRDDQHK